MTEKLQQLVKEKIAKLPKEVQEAINTFDWVKLTEEIGKKYLLNETETSYLQVETLFVFTGVTDEEFFANNIENHVGTTKADAEKIADEIFENIFDPMDNFMEEALKRRLSKETDWKKSMDFILSGGDYSTLLENQQKTPIRPSESGVRGGSLLGTKSMQDMKDKLIN